MFDMETENQISNQTTIQNSVPLNEAICKAIYDTFSSGKVITKMMYNGRKHQLEPNELYSYLFQHFDELKGIYRLIGKHLEAHVSGEFFYINSLPEGDTEEADKHALQIQTLLLIIGRYFESTGRNSLHLGEAHIGFDDTDITEIAKDKEYDAMLQAIGFKHWQGAVEYLINRGFVFRKSSDSYFFSSAATSLCESIIEAYGAINR